ncbi:MAG: hypothetical protein GF311_18710 [Candidatus Lokiarchaeota archaeon]|nr:hypothetical protein [Candidatus Lokiarchaeota archaeon]
MNISEEEVSYVARIYQHGVTHLVDDSIPNRILCIHNLHWCVENLLGKATKDYNIDYRAGFEKRFKKFIGKGNQPPPNIEKSIWKLNEMRNGVEHRENYPDPSVVKKIIPNIEKFIKWILDKVFNASVDLLSISSADEESIIRDFNDWIGKKLTSNHTLTREKFNKIIDYIFFCLIPATCSPGLVDLSFDGINQMVSGTTTTGIKVSMPNPRHKSKLEHYLRWVSEIIW